MKTFCSVAGVLLLICVEWASASDDLNQSTVQVDDTDEGAQSLMQNGGLDLARIEGRDDPWETVQTDCVELDPNEYQCLIDPCGVSSANALATSCVLYASKFPQEVQAAALCECGEGAFWSYCLGEPPDCEGDSAVCSDMAEALALYCQ